MKKAFAAFLIAVVSLTFLGAHAWRTWGAVDSLPWTAYSDREIFEYSLFLESFAFMLSAAYFAGPRLYRISGEEEAAIKFSGEKEKVSKMVHIYSAACVVIRRLSLDPKIGVPISETIIAILLICAPLIWITFKSVFTTELRKKGAQP